MYLTRWYRRPPSGEPLPESRGMDAGFVKYLAVPGDNDTLSITLAIRSAIAFRRQRLQSSTASITVWTSKQCGSQHEPAEPARRSFQYRQLEPVGDLQSLFHNA